MPGNEANVNYNNGMRIEPTTLAEALITQKSANAIGVYNSNGSPEGVLPANVGSVCMDRSTGTQYTKVSGTGNTGWSASVQTSNLIFYKSPLIDFKATGVVDLFTVASGGIFIPFWYVVVMTDLTDYVNDAVFDIGFNAPDYNNFADGVSTFISDIAIPVYTFQTATPNIVIPASSAVKMNITLPEDATTATGYYFLYGITTTI